DRAKAVGAANTLWLEGSRLRSTNTDVEGFLANLDSSVPGWGDGLSSALVLGAGGGAQAVIFALLERGVGTIHVANRTFERAEALRRRFGKKVRPLRWEEMTGRFEKIGLLVNTTSLGMTGQPALQLDLRHLAANAVVADLVYVPLQTSLLASARKCGLRTADGLGMLLHQALRGFSLWFGVRPEVTAELRALVEADLMRPRAIVQ